MHCNVALGFTLKLEHFLHLNRMERKKSLSAIYYDLECYGKGLARWCATKSVNLSCEGMLGHGSVLKKI